MLARAHATTSSASSEPAARSGEGDGDGAPVWGAALVIAHYLDVVLVIAAAPFVLLAGLPEFGYALAAGGWIVIRFASELIKRRAWAARTTGSRAALHLTAIMGRVFLIVAIVLVARFAGHNSDGIMAAVLVLVAFTVEFAISIALRRPLAASAGSRAS